MNFVKKLFSQEGKAKDRVCGMGVTVGENTYISEFEGETYYFCSSQCQQTFNQNPKQFAS